MIKHNLMHMCINTLKPTETGDDISGLDWLEYTFTLISSWTQAVANCDSLHGLFYAITAQGR